MDKNITVERVDLFERTLTFNMPAGADVPAYDNFMESIKPQAVTLPERLLDRNKIIFVHKGQVRVLLDEQVHTLVPGRALSVPQGAWCSFKNTGTGELVLFSVVIPGGLGLFYKEWAAMSPDIDEDKLKALAARFGCEVQQQADERISKSASKSSGRSSAPRKRGRRSAKATKKTVAEGDEIRKPDLGESEPAKKTGRLRGRKRGPAANNRRDRSEGKSAAVQEKSDEGQRTRQSSGKRMRSRTKAKEVYINGKWVEVDVSKPVIALGESRTKTYRKRVQRKQTKKTHE